MHSKKIARKQWHAFSLVELMAAVGIMTILVSLGVPRYQAFIARGRMAEAKVNLGHIAALQGIYRAEWNAYGSLSTVGRTGDTSSTCGTNNSLGFAPDGCEDLRYGYSSTTAFKATATSGTEIYPGCGSSDVWEVTNDKPKPNQTTNVIKYCK